MQIKAKHLAAHSHRELTTLIGSLTEGSTLSNYASHLHRRSDQSFLFQLANPLLQELALGFLLGQRQSFLISGPSLSRPAEPAVHICAG